MDIIALFFSELFVLFLLSRQLQKKLSQFLFSITHSMKWTVSLLAFIFLPGTIIHETAHYLMAHLLFVPVGKMELLPKLEGTSLKLGSVAIAKTDPFRRLLIGVAPFLVGTSIIIFTLFTAEQLNWWKMTVAVIGIFYVLFEIGNSMFSSNKDLEGAIVVVLFVLLVVILGYVLGVRISLGDIERVLSDQTIHVFYQGVMYLLLPLGLDIGLIIVLTLANRLLSR